MIRVLRLAAGGDGVGRLEDGRAVFVPRTAPGDLVQLTGLEARARFARARVAQVVEPGPGRVEPRCRHYIRDACGGCQLQHLEPAAQREAKRGIVADALERIGKLRVVVPPLVAGPSDWEYRSRITLAVGPGRRHAGFHPLGEPGRVFPLERCLLAAPPLMTLWAALQPALSLLPADATQLLLRLGREGGLHVVVKARGEAAWTRGADLAARLDARGVTATIWWHPEGGALRVVAGDRTAMPATVFEQVHPGLGDRIRAWALEALGPVDGVRVWDLYAGIGETTAALQARGAVVDSVELDRQAVEVGERRWRELVHAPAETQRPLPAGVTCHVGRVEDLIGTLPDPGAVIANPPRAGMARGALETLRVRRAARLVYISCDPATLARDLGVLCGSAPGTGTSPGYRLLGVQPFDLFPQTAHVETVAVLEGV